MDKVDEARESLRGIASEKLDQMDAEEVARMREEVGAVRDLLDEKDLEGALRVAREAAERMARTGAELRDQAAWVEEDSATDVTALRAVVSRLVRAVGPMREVVKELTAWKREKDSLVGPAERAEAKTLKQEQDAVAVQGSRIVETIATVGKAEAALGVAASARRNMEEASRRLAETRPAAAEAHQRQAVQDLLRLRRVLEQGAEAAAREVKGAEPVVTIPEAVQRPDDLAVEIASYRKEPALPAYSALVKAYYDAIVKR